MAYGLDFDTGRAVVVPYLRSQGVGGIDMLVVSHADNDHMGGVASLLKEYPVDDIRAGVPERVTIHKARQCRRGGHWRWDGVDFVVLHPDARRYRKGNDASCVIRVESRAGQRALLTGDIESIVEQRLLTDSPDRLSADVLVVPHHGSLTSSSPAFVEAIHPDYALFSTGYRNRFRFPREPVKERYREADSVLLDTAVKGAITVWLASDGQPPQVEAYRCAERRYWRTRVCDADTGYGCCDE